MQTKIKKLFAWEGLVIIWLFILTAAVAIFWLHWYPFVPFLIIYPIYVVFRFTYWAIKTLVKKEQ